MGSERAIEERRHRIAVRATASLAVVTCLLGVAAAVSFAGPGGHRVIRAAVAPVATLSTDNTTMTTTTSTEPTTAVPPTTTGASTTTAPKARSTTTTAPPAVIFGRVTHEGRPVEGARLTLAGPPRERETFTDAGGSYRFDLLAQGQYDIYLWAESAPAPCSPGGPCVGSAMSVERRPVVLSAGTAHQEDWTYPYDSPPTYGTSYSTPPVSSTTTPA